MLPREEALEFLDASLDHWKQFGNKDAHARRKFAEAIFEYLVTCEASPQGLLRRVEERRKEDRRRPVDISRVISLYQESRG